MDGPPRRCRGILAHYPRNGLCQVAHFEKGIFVESSLFLCKGEYLCNAGETASFYFAPFQKVSARQYISATATNKATGDTSEFSEAEDVKGTVIGP